MKFATALKLFSVAVLVVVCCVLGTISFPGCTKTPLPIHDTLTVVKNDTLIKNDTTRSTDTLYATKPDPTVNLAKGLLLYLPFSGSLADSSGNNNPVSPLNGAGLTYDAHGWANNAYGSNGINQALLVTNNGSIKFDTAWTVSLDFMTNDLTARHNLIAMINWTDVSGYVFELGNTLPTLPSMFTVAAADSGTGCGVNPSYSTTIPNRIGDSTGFVPIVGAWYNVIVIYHRGSTQFYLNGRLYSSKTGPDSQANFCPSSNVVIGGWWANDPASLNGKMDNVRLYNRVLTPHEITALAANYQVTSTAVRPGLRTH